MQHQIGYEPHRSRKPSPIGLLLFVDIFVMFFAALVGHDQDDPTIPHPVFLIIAMVTVLFTLIMFFVLLGVYVVRRWRKIKAD